MSLDTKCKEGIKVRDRIPESTINQEMLQYLIRR